MKKFYLLPMLGLLLASCVSEEPASGNNADDLVATNYISINIVPSSGLSTRADNVTSNGTYRDGTPSENAVNRVRFFFFDANNNATPVRVSGENEYESFLDWYPSANEVYGGTEESETVEKSFKATLGIFTPDDEEYDNPTSVIAVLNPSEAVLSLSYTTGTTPTIVGPSLAQLQAVVSDFKSGLTDNNFVMSNSVYAVPGTSTEADTPSTSTEVVATSLLKEDGTYFYSNIEQALADPVTIYVERVVARLDLSISIPNGKSVTYQNETFTIYPVNTVNEEDGSISTNVTINGVATPVYVRFLGWNVTSTPGNSNLLKDINKDWTNQGLFGSSTLLWTTKDFHRSFWAMNPSNPNIQYGSFSSTDNSETNFQPADKLDMPEPESYETVYLQENASPFNASGAAATPASATKVILAAQLVDATGAPLPLAEWGFRKYLLSDLKTYLIGTICNGNNFYKKTTENGVVKYVPLSPTDVTFQSAHEKYGDELPEGVKGYYSYLVLTPEASAATVEWTIGNAQDAPSTTAQAINQYLFDKVNYSMVWDNGYSYYYFDVRHLGLLNSIGYYGIVRNHLYEANVTSLLGLGTPVWNPNETIYPEKPEYEESIIAAEIKILQWRVVSNSYELSW